MWCRSCQQDVPAVASTSDATMQCARCHSELSAAQHVNNDGEVHTSPTTTATPKDHHTALETDVSNGSIDAALRSWESWELAEDLRAADHLVNSLGIRRTDAAHKLQTDSATMTSEPRIQPTDQQPATNSPATRAVRKPRRGSFMSWSVLSLGLMTFAFGAVLLGWSFWMGRADLWRLGMPFTLAGQATLVIGLALQLDGLWRSNQASAESVHELDNQLDELRRATTLLSTSHSGPSQSFYSHMASGAGPHLLLADLKSQLDLLAIKLGTEKQ